MFNAVLFDGVNSCPHCGSEAFVLHYINPRYYKVRCSNAECAACSGGAPTPQGAKDLWNRRKNKVG